MKFLSWIHYLTSVIIGLFIGLVLITLSKLFYFSYLDFIYQQVIQLHSIHIEEFLILFVFSTIGILSDLLRWKNRMKETAHRDKMNSFHATLRTVQDLVYNSFNSLQIIKIEAEENGTLNADSLLLFDSIIKSTAKKIKLLGDLEDIILIKNTENVETVSYSNAQ